MPINMLARPQRPRRPVALLTFTTKSPLNGPTSFQPLMIPDPAHNSGIDLLTLATLYFTVWQPPLSMK